MRVFIDEWFERRGYTSDGIIHVCACRNFNGNKAEAMNFFHRIEESVEYYCGDFHQMVLDISTGNNSFYLKFYTDGCTKVAHVNVVMGCNGFAKLRWITMHTEDKEIKKNWEEGLKKVFEDYNLSLYDSVLKEAGIADTGNVSISFDEYVDYEKKYEMTKEGTLDKVFEEFTNYNDRLRYCNGHYLDFHDKRMEKVYGLYVSLQKGNYFLNCAVKRGALID